MPPLADDVARSLAEARAGSAEALGRLLDSCRGYLLMLAGREFDPALRAKANPSDIVQETFLEAFRDFGQFRGNDEAELLAWLRRLLLNNLANFGRGYRDTDKRAIARERPTTSDGDGSFLHAIPCGKPSAATQAVQREGAAALQTALAGLPEDYREVLHYRFHDKLTFDEIGARIGRSGNAICKLWGRAVERLQQEMRGGDGVG